MVSTILVTGVSQFVGGTFATRCAAEHPNTRVLGVDSTTPKTPLAGVEFVRADIRSPAVASLLVDNEVETVVHLGMLATSQPAGGRATMKEINVIGSMQLFAACAKSPSLRRLVVKSTSGVYGASRRDPALFVESDPARSLPRTGWGKDSLEVEGYARGLVRRRPNIEVTILRLANIVGPMIKTALTQYFSLPTVPIHAGFDPRLQFLHEDDALDVLQRAVDSTTTGTFNVAGDGVITMMQALGLVAKVPLPVPSALVGTTVRTLSGGLHLRLTDDTLRYLRYGRAIDTSAVTEQLGFVPKYSTKDAFADFARHHDQSHMLRDFVHDKRQSVTTFVEHVREQVNHD